MDLLPARTERFLKLIYKYDAEFDQFAFHQTSDDPNWPRIQYLLKCGYILEQPADFGPPKYIISPEGEAYLQDSKKLKRKEAVKTGITITTLIIAFLTLLVTVLMYMQAIQPPQLGGI